MPEEKPTTDQQILTLLSRLDEKIDARFERVDTRFNGIEQRMARMEGGFDQMDKRISGVEQRMSSSESLQRWAIGLIVTSWLTLIGLSLTVLVKLP